MIVRDETRADEPVIDALIADAFRGHPRSLGDEPRIVRGLRECGVLTVSLVAEDSGRIVGHVAFSPVQIAGAICHWFGLGPLSVHPDRQGRGIGSALVHEGIRHLRERSARGCVVLGYPAYYQRFGFQVEPRLTLAGSTPGHFMALCLDPPSPEGRVGYHPAFAPGASLGIA